MRVPGTRVPLMNLNYRVVLDFWANQTPLFRGKLLRHPNSPDLSDGLIPFSQYWENGINPKKKKWKSSSLTFMPRKREDRPKTGQKKKPKKKTRNPGAILGHFSAKISGSK